MVFLSFLHICLPVTVLEEKQVITKLQEFNSPGCKALRGESRLGKESPEGFSPRMSLATAMCFHVCRCHFSLVYGMV